jgi:hypothetical protein
VSTGVAQAPALNEAAPHDRSVLSTHIHDDDILEVPNIRHMLRERDSPFVDTNNRGGGCARGVADCLCHDYVEVTMTLV